MVGDFISVKVTLLVVEALDAFSIRKALLRYQMVATQVLVGNDTGLLVFDGHRIVHLLHLVGRIWPANLFSCLTTTGWVLAKRAFINGAPGKAEKMAVISQTRK